MMNGFGGQCVFDPLIVFKKQNTRKYHQDLGLPKDLNACKLGVLLPNEHFPNGIHCFATTEGHLEVAILAVIMDFCFALSEPVFKFIPIFNSLVLNLKI